MEFYCCDVVMQVFLGLQGQFEQPSLMGTILRLGRMTCCSYFGFVLVATFPWLACREDMSIASLLGGLALANAKLGAVHGCVDLSSGLITLQSFKKIVSPASLVDYLSKLHTAPFVHRYCPMCSGKMRRN